MPHSLIQFYHSAVISIKTSIALSLLALLFFPGFAQAEEVGDKCILDTIKNSQIALTYEQIKEACAIEDVALTPQEIIPKKAAPKGRLAKRNISEKRNAFDPYVITPHKMNYILPVNYTNKVNREVYAESNDWSESLTNTEAKFQISIKVPLNKQSIFTPYDGIFFGFTLQSWWQVYSDGISKPFRETNYQPELFYYAPLDLTLFEGNTGFAVGIEHQSNGRTQGLSRSWNRAYVNFLYEKDNFTFSFQPWWRLPESDKEFFLDPEGDDNPDISDFMGYFHVATVYKWDVYEFTFIGRENFVTHNGGMELGLTFPLWGKLRGYLQYTNGYGESLIDYNHSQQTLGLGIALTNVL
ncbi:phospholipase A [Pseudocolwellia sp. HL-MZ19]|uniref:phospholipase A n=1 Tax=unclassified Pseudocolwellia TaxID=2848178 RepID=UPI003CF64F39